MDKEITLEALFDNSKKEEARIALQKIERENAEVLQSFREKNDILTRVRKDHLGVFFENVARFYEDLERGKTEAEKIIKKGIPRSVLTKYLAFHIASRSTPEHIILEGLDLEGENSFIGFVDRCFDEYQESGSLHLYNPDDPNDPLKYKNQ